MQSILCKGTFSGILISGVLVHDRHGYLGVLLVPNHVVNGSSLLVKTSEICDMEEPEDGWSATSFFMMSAAMMGSLPQLAGSDLERLLLAVGDLTDL